MNNDIEDALLAPRKASSCFLKGMFLDEEGRLLETSQGSLRIEKEMFAEISLHFLRVRSGFFLLLL